MMTKVSNERAVAAFAGLQSLRNAQSEAVAEPLAFGTLPLRSECICPCHSAPDGMLHIAPCCRPQPNHLVAVKPLEWLGDRAITPLGKYSITRTPDGYQASFEEEELVHVGHNAVDFFYGARRKAQDYAQTDYEQRIRSALTHPAPPLAVTDERITEAVDLIVEASGYTGDPDALRLINKALEALTAALEAKQ